MSGIRITAGTHKGRSITTARNGRTRYTAGKVREAVFDLVGDIDGKAVLDLFAGAGSFTAEALSRGAGSVTSVEKDRNTAALLRNNLKSLSLDKDCLVLNMDVKYAVPMLARQGKTFDLIFVDPPYEMDYIASTAELLRKHPVYRRDAFLIFEHSKREELAELQETEHEVKTRKYGDTVLTIFRCGKPLTYREE